MREKFEDRIDEADAEVLRKLSVGKTAVFEFGTFAGASAMAMLPQIKEAGGHLWCVGHFRDDFYSNEVQRIHPSEVLGYLMNRIEAYLPMVTVIGGDIAELENYPAGIADMVFIDAAHSYSDVKRDIGIALHLCRPGGTLCGHDYNKHYVDCDPDVVEAYADVGNGFYNGLCYGVIKAVHEHFGTPSHEAGIWWITRE